MSFALAYSRTKSFHFTLRFALILLCVTYSVYLISFTPDLSAEIKVAADNNNKRQCQSLFMISEMSAGRYSDIIRYSDVWMEGKYKNDKGNKTSYIISEMTRLSSLFETASRHVKSLVGKRRALTGVLSEDYYKLARLLPPVLYKRVNSADNSGLTHVSNDGNSATKRKKRKDKNLFFSSDERKHQEYAPTPLRNRYENNRLSNSFLPYVPCRIKTYNDISHFAVCVKRRLAGGRRLSIVFMGDSKLRNLYRQVLNMTDEIFLYNVSYKNKTVPWRFLGDAQRNHDVVRWRDMIATSPIAQHLNITFRYSRFDEVTSYQYWKSEELRDLSRWLRSEEPLPDLLVMGYTPWMLYHQIDQQSLEKFFANDVLDYLLGMHTTVIPLLEELSSRTRVLVLPQSRTSINASFLAHGAYSNALLDWSEIAFLLLLQRYRKEEGKQRQEELRASQFPSGDSQQKQNFFWNRVNQLYFQTYLGSLQPFGRLLKSFYKYLEDYQDEKSEVKYESFLEYLVRIGKFYTQSFQKIFRPSSKNVDMEKVDALDPLIHSRLSPEGEGTFDDPLRPSETNSGLWWWDTSLPLNLAGILECHHIAQEGLMNDPGYDDHLLTCRDGVHAGPATRSEMVTMLFNLVCNSVLNTSSDFCCSR